MRLARYFVVGGVAALVDWSAFWILTSQAGIYYQFSAFASFTLATLLNYVLSIQYVFESGVRYARHHELFLVYVASAIGLLINLSALYAFFEFLGFQLLAAKVCATGVVFGWNYIVRSRFIFRPV